jgi:hypothetical protein
MGRIGGKITQERSSRCYHLALGKREGYELLVDVRPYLLVKAQEADAYLQLADRDYRNGRRISEEELTERARLVDGLSALRLQRYADYVGRPELAPGAST